MRTRLPSASGFSGDGATTSASEASSRGATFAVGEEAGDNATWGGETAGAFFAQPSQSTSAPNSNVKLSFSIQAAYAETEAGTSPDPVAHVDVEHAEPGAVTARCTQLLRSAGPYILAIKIAEMS